ncbi:hypothetical protein J5N97_003248 [Dioscorea zingiberensis]|uniref:Transmembrane protein n=1 Tax=Dioscorea zingiberensis TaxID=325984 RepID=A0A9D5D5L6_9LILI|nr:hypothetical protein J5N97_003248 [Dioscorea zingiberensis]
MRAEDMKRMPAGQPDEAKQVLHQRRRLPLSPARMALGGFLIVASVGYFTLYHKSKPGTTHTDVVKATVGPGKDDAK